MAAFAAVVAGLIGRPALGARAAHKSIRQKRAHHGVEKLLNVLLLHQAGSTNRLPDFIA
jgi:hypothetical protein